MKRRLAAVAVALVLLGVGLAVAIGGSSGDPLVSKSYLEGTYASSLEETLAQRADKGTQATYDQAVKKLDAAGEADVAAAGKLRGEAAGYEPVSLEAGDAVELQKGASLVAYGGGAQVSAGTLADVTTGETLGAGKTLAAAHRYIVTSDGAALAVTQDGQMGFQGQAQVKEGQGSVWPFQDVGTGDWYYDAVSYVYTRKYFSGTGETTFSPNVSMTRAMVATVLHRMAGNETVADTTAFTDVPAGQWYSEGIAWASDHKVVNGMGDGRYEPDTAVTREQLVTMLYRYQKDYRQVAVPGKGDLSAFPDGDKVNSWARDAMSWAVGTGLLQGRDTGRLDPTGTASRAEVATILKRFDSL